MELTSCAGCGNPVPVNQSYCNVCGTPVPLTDALLRLAAGQDRQAVSMLYDRTSTDVFRTVEVLSADAEDRALTVLQTYRRVLPRLRRLPAGELKLLLQQTAAELIADRRWSDAPRQERDPGRERAFAPVTMYAAPVSPDGPSSPEFAQAGLAALSDGQRMAAGLYYDCGRSVEQIAELLGISPVSVTELIFSAGNAAAAAVAAVDGTQREREEGINCFRRSLTLLDGAREAKAAKEELLRQLLTDSARLPAEPVPCVPGGERTPRPRDASEAPEIPPAQMPHTVRPSGRKPTAAPRDGTPAAIPEKTGFLRTTPGKILLAVIIVAVLSAAAAVGIAVFRGRNNPQGHKTDVGAPAEQPTATQQTRPESREEKAAAALRTYLEQELIPTLGVAKSVKAAPLSEELSAPAEGMSGLLLADLYDYTGEGIPQLLTAVVSQVSPSELILTEDGPAQTSPIPGIELQLYRWDGDRVKLDKTCRLDGFGFSMVQGRYQPSLELYRRSAASGASLYLHYTDSDYTSASGADVYRVYTMNDSPFTPAFDAAVTSRETEAYFSASPGADASKAPYEQKARQPLRSYGYYLDAGSKMASLDAVPMFACREDVNPEIRLCVLSCKEQTGILSAYGGTSGYAEQELLSDYLSRLLQMHDRINDYETSFYYRRGTKVAFADLTGDGADEMIYVYTDYSADASYAYYEVVTGIDGYVLPLYSGVWETGYSYPVQDRRDHAVAMFQIEGEAGLYLYDQVSVGDKKTDTMIRLLPMTDYSLRADAVPGSEITGTMSRAKKLIMYTEHRVSDPIALLSLRLDPCDMSLKRAVNRLQKRIEELEKEHGAGMETEPLKLSAGTLSFTSAGQTAVLSVTNLPEDATVRWTSSDSSVATVGANGLVTALRPGTAVITASSGARSAECAVTCTWEAGDDPGPADLPEELHLLNYDMTFFNPGESYVQAVTNVPAGTKVSWKSLDPAVATVSADGRITAVGEGTTNIVATVGDRTAECIVRCRFD